MNPSMINLLRQSTSAADNHKDWLTAMRFGLGELVDNPIILIELVQAEVDRQISDNKEDGDRFLFAHYMDELKIRFEVTP
jgi:hypothetical protein